MPTAVELFIQAWGGTPLAKEVAAPKEVAVLLWHRTSEELRQNMDQLHAAVGLREWAANWPLPPHIVEAYRVFEDRSAEQKPLVLDKLLKQASNHELWSSIGADIRADTSGRVALSYLTQQEASLFLKGPICPTYPDVSWDLGVKVTQGVKPTELAPGLTAQEAHLWLLSGAKEDAFVWLLWHLAPETVDMGQLDVRSVPVARWVAKMLKSPSRARVLRMEHVDLLEPEDLPGVGGVAGVAARCQARLALAPVGGVGPPLPWEGRRISGMRHLRTASALVREGARMNHCAGDYASRVASGTCHLFSVQAGKARATLEIEPDGKIRQLKGPLDKKPHEFCVRVVNRQLALWGLPPCPDNLNRSLDEEEGNLLAANV